mmetsp:Transcript_2968/g.4496  ORF Transcript_2968/g.4496 Transcript_2968/m.4496 type:complete len:202 (-) Transcript_2968:200-805(-)
MSPTSALLVIDLQPAFTSSLSETSLFTFKQNVSECLTLFRSSHPPPRIIHVRAVYTHTPMVTYSRVMKIHKPYPTDTAAVEWAQEMQGEMIITKDTINGFHNTQLADYLTACGVTHVYLMGMLTAACVHETAVGAMNRGFIPLLINEACIDKTPQRHQAVIDLYDKYLYQVISINQLRDSDTADGEDEDSALHCSDTHSLK